MENEMVKCSCQGYNIDRLLQPHVLTILKYNCLTGYMIYQELIKYPMYNRAKPDLTGFYRQLNLMEGRGHIKVIEERKKANSIVKIYGITTEGRDCLDNWKSTLEDYSNAIEFLLDEMNGIS